MVAEPAAPPLLIGFLPGLDLVTEVVLPRQPVDGTLPWLLTDAGHRGGPVHPPTWPSAP